MGRADEIRARMESDIALAEAEDRLTAAKAEGIDGDEYRAIKDEVRAARQASREQREGDAAAVPQTVAVTTTVKG